MLFSSLPPLMAANVEDMRLLITSLKTLLEQEKKRADEAEKKVEQLKARIAKQNAKSTETATEDAHRDAKRETKVKTKALSSSAAK